MQSRPLVRDRLRTDVITINPELHIERVWELMEHEHVRHLPVVKNDQLMDGALSSP